MKKQILVSLLVAGISFGAMAQNPNPAKKQRPQLERKSEGNRFTAEERAEIYAKRMQKSLNLSDEQYKKVLAINVEQAKQREEFRAARQAEMQANRTKMKAQHDATTKKFEAVLTPEQMSKLKEQQEHQKTDFIERRGRK